MACIQEPVYVQEIVNNLDSFLVGNKSFLSIHVGSTMLNYIYVEDGMIDFPKIVKELIDELEAARMKIFRLKHPNFF